ncbi:haloacid dehalogenase type II [Zunongwangia sp. F363]|uniref:Haloacid dehalogenase type II n=1 Tax=Autumnicola tepida TaxID=3075595 RepID=A0ABU3C7B0_9FLAO|nr:haloacid dehalogenase type II [Zunongwangia sp. F363]MDT0642230.1 haloacid dehalogenase type II [Zunongwangia sp. F363]
MDKRPRLLIFDVNETLLDMSPLKESVNAALENKNAFDAWFPMLLQYSLVETITGEYHDFSEVAAATFQMLAKKWNFFFSEEEIKEVLEPVKRLPPYPDVAKGLEILQKQGLTLVALTNGKPSVATEQLKFAKIDQFFEHIWSVEVVKKYKPHASTYNFVLEQTGTSAENAMMVAAHGWDIAGAKNAGLQTAFIERAGKSLYPLAKKPDLQKPSITALAEKLL